MNSSDLRLWTMQMPRPSCVRVTTTDGAQHELACGPTAKVGWKKLADTLAALDWQLIEALDDKGNLIRATRPERDEDEDESAAQPMVAAPQGSDPETQRFVLVAQLIAHAYKHSTDTAFERLSDMIEAASKRAEEGDRARENFYRAQVRSLESQLRAAGREPVETPGGDLLGPMLMQFMSGAASRGAPIPNGKDHSDAE